MTALLLAAQIVWSGPRPTPQEAADVMRRLASQANMTERRPLPDVVDGPVVVISGSPTAGPFGEFPTYLYPINPPYPFTPWPMFRPALNGTTYAVHPLRPRIVIIPSRPGEGPFGPLPVYQFRPLNCCSIYVNGVPWFGPRPASRSPRKGRTWR